MVQKIPERAPAADAKTLRRKRQILEAASRVFRRRGLHATGMRDIAAELMQREVVEHFIVEVETIESIHDHNAYGYVSRTRDDTHPAGWK